MKNILKVLIVFNMLAFPISNINALENEIYVNNAIKDIHTTRLYTFFDICDNQDRNAEIKKIYDSNSDGKWNHVAFVTATKSGATSAGYRDFKVTQHTKNYHAWVSSINGWENISSIKATIVTPS